MPEPHAESKIITAQDDLSSTLILAVSRESGCEGGLGVCGAPWTVPCRGLVPCVGTRVCRA